MTKTEASLLLYLETVCVDQSGVVELARMNADDITIAKEWHEKGFLAFRRYTNRNFSDGQSFQGEVLRLTYLVELNDESWEKAHELRRQRAERNRITTAPYDREDCPEQIAYVNKEVKKARKLPS